MTLDELRQTWAQRRDEWRRLGVQCDGAKVCEEIITDLEQLEAAGEEALTLVDASKECGYSADHLGRLVRSGEIPNAGRPNAPRIRRRDLPRKPGTFAEPDVDAIMPSRRRIAASVLTLNDRRQDG